MKHLHRLSTRPYLPQLPSGQEEQPRRLGDGTLDSWLLPLSSGYPGKDGRDNYVLSDSNGKHVRLLTHQRP